MEETGIPGENHRPVASHWQTLSHNVVPPHWSIFELTKSVVIGTDYIGSCKSIKPTKPTNQTMPWQLLMYLGNTY